MEVAVGGGGARVAVEGDGATGGELGAGGDVECLLFHHVERAGGNRSELDIAVVVTVIDREVSVGGRGASEPLVLDDDAVFVEVEAGDGISSGRRFREGKRFESRIIIYPGVDRHSEEEARGYGVGDLEEAVGGNGGSRKETGG